MDAKKKKAAITAGVLGGLLGMGLIIASKAKAGTTPPEGGVTFYMPPAMTVEVTGGGQILSLYWNCAVSLVIQNRSSVAATYNLHVWDSVNNLNTVIPITIAPGDQYTWTHSQWIDFRRITTYTVYAQGDWQNNNYAVGVCHI